LDSYTKQKPIVLVIGRQHSGETHSSFIIHGLINFLLKKDIRSQTLRELFEWWIVPMVNPDGVIVGNYRNNLQGKDMNRHFFPDKLDDPDALQHGRCHEVELLRSYLKENSDGLLTMFLDIHAHSIEHSIFTYSPLPDGVKDVNTTRQFAMILNDLSPYFSLKSCRDNNEYTKRNCARLGIFRDWSLVNSYTIESSCFGY
jgi:murein tripeptide amidase MpaA